MYKINYKNQIIRLVDNAIVVKDPENFLYQEYLVWISEGNKPEPPVDDPSSFMKVYHSLKKDGLTEEAEDYLKLFKK
jgi:hypothetical protein